MARAVLLGSEFPPILPCLVTTVLAYLVFRGGFERSDSYLLLQGYQGGFRWQGHMKAANCLGLGA